MKALKWTGIVLGGLIVLALLVGVALYPIGMGKLTRSYPGIQVEAVAVPAGPDAVARGRHIAIVWKCAECHGANMGGKLLYDNPFVGTLPAANLTSGKGGIGVSYTDTDWVRAIRHGVKPDDRVVVAMEDYYWTMSDRDLGDLLAYLKQLQPVDSNLPALRIGPLLAVAPALGMLTPMAESIDHGAPRPAEPVPAATAEYGRYLAPLCSECHGTRLGSKLGTWQEQDFARALRTGALPGGGQLSQEMPLEVYSEMSDTEIAALWLYLKNLPAASAQK